MLDLSNPLVKLLLPLLGIAASYFIAAKRFKYSLQQDLFLVPPTTRSLLLWVPIYLVYMLGTDAVFNWRGTWNFQPWREQPLLTSIARVLAVCLFGPIAEELICRGLLLRKLNRFIQNRWICLIIVTAIWTVMHVSYSTGILVIIFFNGILLGFSLYHARSLAVPMILHIIWNVYAVW